MENPALGFIDYLSVNSSSTEVHQSVHNPRPVPVDTARGEWYNSKGMGGLKFRDGKVQWHRTDTVKWSNDSTTLIERSDWNKINAY